MKLSVEERLWAKVDTSGGPEACWPWLGGCAGDGYGTMKVNGKTVYVHRIVARALPDQHVRHSCDNPPCCNPAHVVAGTQIANMADMVTKGRSARGEKHGRAKLTVVQVIAIHADPRTGTAIATAYGVNHTLIYKIKRGENWKDAA